MNEFTKAELIGRNLLKEIFNDLNITKYQFTKGVYDRLDAYFRLKGHIVSSEIKVRATKYESYDTHIMEVDKYNAMLEDMKKRNLAGSFYICFFGETAYIYNINKVVANSKQNKCWCPRTSAVNSDYCWKDCYLIDKRIATVFKKVDGVWIKQEN